jgi:hypothetical protein
MRIPDEVYLTLKSAAGSENISSYIRRVILELEPTDRKCELCGWEGICDTHHKDKDYTNNNKDNLQTICPNCHRMIHNNRIPNKMITPVNTTKPLQVPQVDNQDILPRYDPSKHKTGDWVMILEGKNWVKRQVPEMDAEGYKIYWE